MHTAPFFVEDEVCVHTTHKDTIEKEGSCRSYIVHVLYGVPAGLGMWLVVTRVVNHGVRVGVRPYTTVLLDGRLGPSDCIKL